MKEPLCKITINSEPPKPTTLEDLGYVQPVRCKDCKHRPKKPDWATFEDGGDIEFPENSKCPCQNTSDRYYSWYPDDDWFCANGETQNEMK